MWERAATAAGVPRFTLMGVLGGLAARGEHHDRVWEILGVEHPASSWERSEFYPDALPCLVRASRRAAARRSGRQHAASRPRRCSVRTSTSSARRRAGASRSRRRRSSTRVAEEAGCRPAKIAYVGDRVDNDVGPALAAGMVGRPHPARTVGASARAARGRDSHPLARRAARGASVSYRVGIGVDAHALEDGVPLVLGGVAIDHPRVGSPAIPTATCSRTR